MTREETLPGLVLPEFTPWGVRWHGGDSIGRLMHRIRVGDPVKGWEGDSRLELYYHREQDRWALLRLEWDGVQRLVRLLPVGERPDERLVDWLVTHDVRRGYDVASDVERHNDRIDRSAETSFREAAADSADRLVYAVSKGRIA